jgi:hypothetical protein
MLQAVRNAIFPLGRSWASAVKPLNGYAETGSEEFSLKLSR